MAAPKTRTFVNIEDFLTPKTYPYEVQGFGWFELRDLTHGDVRALQAIYQTETGIINFPALLEDLILAACPAFTREKLVAFTGGEDVLRTLGVHIGHKCGWLSNPPEQDVPKVEASADPTAADGAGGNSL